VRHRRRRIKGINESRAVAKDGEPERKERGGRDDQPQR